MRNKFVNVGEGLHYPRTVSLASDLEPGQHTSRPASRELHFQMDLAEELTRFVSYFKETLAKPMNWTSTGQP